MGKSPFNLSNYNSTNNEYFNEKIDYQYFNNKIKKKKEFIENDIIKIIESKNATYKLPYLDYTNLEDFLFSKKDPENKYPYLIEVNK